MELEVRPAALTAVEAELTLVPLAAGDELPEELSDAPGVDDVRSRDRDLTLLRPERPGRVLVAGLGEPADVDAERLRVAGALAAKRARRYEARELAVHLPRTWPAVSEQEAAAALVEGAALAAFRFDRFRSKDPERPDPPPLERIVLLASDEVEASAAFALTGAEASNRARELQHLPANFATPRFLVERAEEIAAGDAVELEVLGPERMEELGMGGMIAVSQGSAQEPALITLTYRGRGGGETLGIVGKAVTFDTGGISLKPSGSMHEMKMDMSGGAAALEGFRAIVEQGIEHDVVCVVPAVENMPSATATRPGDVITQLNGKTVEVNNTDAEGRLILADALTWCAREKGADRIVDLATLTGAVVIALGSTHSALIGNDDAWVERVRAAGESVGELGWRLPLHPEYKELTKGTIADLTNAAAKRKAGTIYAGSFLEEFVEGRPWVHIDIAGTAWDQGREYVGKGPTGVGARTLLALARGLSGSE